MASAYSSESESSEFEDVLVDTEGYLNVEPYMFEPLISLDHNESDHSDESDEEVEDERPERAGNRKWCDCGNCTAQITGTESMCCSDYSPVLAKKESYEPDGVACITLHPGFASNCLDRYVLESAMYEFIQDQGPIGNDQPMHKLWRYLAYRRFVRWCWQRLGKKQRLPLPVCARDKIRSTWPSDEYTGFRYPKS
ncbi:uncharacterized protein LOC135499789 [Lineus longissimus]|uniref:uncharacterized protein LOC135499789 n=1 Tax=Lineus longissimus TaxID=88925 RepID=UPI00315CDBBE